MSNEPIIGRCHCGIIRFLIKPPIKWCAHCHCPGCRMVHGAAMITWFGVDVPSLRLGGREHLKWYISSKEAKRGFCVHCGSPLLFMSTRWPDEVHVTRASIVTPFEVAPGGHVYFDQRVEWLVLGDQLPRLGGKTGMEPLGDQPAAMPSDFAPGHGTE
jgi:hypothetical protein